ncbi:recombinase family protein [Microbacterium enclense]|uniref:recombinase family protein n=1 Tax=Microbacterium enclense TaxID=993073 RepID=UPI003D72E923
MPGTSALRASGARPAAVLALDARAARTSTSDQNTSSQKDELWRAGVDRIWIDQCSGSTPPLKRPEFARLLDVARGGGGGDELVVWALDRLGRNAASVLTLVELLDERGVTLRVLREGILTSGPTGRLVLQLLAAVAEMERSSILERSRIGVEAARARGTHLGRPASLTAAQKEHARTMRRAGESVAQIARVLGTSKATVLLATRPTSP